MQGNLLRVRAYSKVEYINNQNDKAPIELALGTCHASLAVYTCGLEMAFLEQGPEY